MNNEPVPALTQTIIDAITAHHENRPEGWHIPRGPNWITHIVKLIEEMRNGTTAPQWSYPGLYLAYPIGINISLHVLPGGYVTVQLESQQFPNPEGDPELTLMLWHAMRGMAIWMHRLEGIINTEVHP